MLRWDGMLPGVEPAGVAPPLTAPTLAGSGAGAITGTYSAFVRFVDRLGRYSDLSPAMAAEVTVTGVSAILYTNVAVPQSPAVTRKQLLRNTAGQANTFYVDIDTDQVGNTSFTSTRIDSNLQTQEIQALFDAQNKDIANLYGVPPNHKAYLSQHQTRMFAAGEIEYAEGAVVVTFGSTTITGIGTDWKEGLEGRFIYFDDSTEYYEIDEVDESAQTATLLTPYRGTTDPYLYYKIRSAPAERNTVNYSEAGQPEGWPALNAFTIAEDGFDITGLMQMGTYLYILKRRRIYRLTSQTDPAVDGFVFFAARRGCINHRCWVNLGDEAFLLDDNGVYRYDGSDIEEIDQPIQEIFRSTNQWYKINWNTSMFWHAVHDTLQKTIRWFISLGGDYLPKHALCYNYALKRWWVEAYPMRIGCSHNGRQAVTPGTWRLQARDQVYYGTPAKKIFASGVYALDGPNDKAGTVRGTVTSAGILSFTDSLATFSTDLVGTRVYLVRGKGYGQNRLITAVSGDVVSIDQPWSEMPDTTSVYVLGGIPWEYRTGKFAYASSETRATRNAVVDFEPCDAEFDIEGNQIPATYDVAYANVFHDYAKTPRLANRDFDKGSNQGVGAVIDSGDIELDMTVPEGVLVVRLDAHLERYSDGPGRIALDLRGVSGASPVALNRITLEGVVSRKSQQKPEEKPGKPQA